MRRLLIALAISVVPSLAFAAHGGGVVMAAATWVAAEVVM